MGGHNGQLHENVFVPMIRRGAAFPARKGDRFSTMHDGQKAVDVRIYQGEDSIADDNIFIGNFLFEGLSDVPAGNEIVLTLALDLNGVVEVTALEKRTGLSKTVTMQAGDGAAPFDLERSREHLGGWIEFRTRSEAPVSSGDAPGEKGRVLAAAKDLRQRATALLDDIDATDASELRTLLADAQKAIAEGRFQKLSELNESLSDMLFYLED